MMFRLTIAPKTYRPTTFYVLSTNLFSLALGPTSVALASDYIFESTQAVGSSLALVGATVLPMAVLLLWRGLSAISSEAES